ncbi:putative Holliday junction resolvase [Hordeum vulgare]|nr:putative Holliday junction resolvase [Hordeum vulgare]
MTVASTNYMGMNALHDAGGYGKLPVYQYLVEEVRMEVNKPDTAQVTFLTMALICISNARETSLFFSYSPGRCAMRLLKAEELLRKLLEGGSKKKARLLRLDVSSKYVGLAVYEQQSRFALPLRHHK